MSNIARIIFICTLNSVIFFSASAFSYEVSTHVHMSGYAAKRSVLMKDEALAENIGLEPGFLNNEEVVFPTETYSDMADQHDAGYRTAIDAIKYGADVEDSGIRPFRHFYNPQDGGAGFGWFDSSPDWALEYSGENDSQEYSLRDANQKLFDAIVIENESERKRQLGMFFRNLGQVIHHVQDMAQPQHTRADDHCKLIRCYVLSVSILYKPSAYELFSEKKLNGMNLTTAFTSYPVPVFEKAESYIISNNSKKGIAHYTSENFVSAGTNLRFDKTVNQFVPGSNDLPLPAGNASIIRTNINIGSLEQGFYGGLPDSSALGGKIQFLGWNVRDDVTDVIEENLSMSTTSIFYKLSDLYNIALAGGILGTNLNEYNYYQHHKFLIPRAIAYSAGLINYFFRGKLQVETATENGSKITLEIKNVSQLVADDGITTQDFTIFDYADIEVVYVKKSCGGCEEERVPVTGLSGSHIQNKSLITPLNYNEVMTVTFDIPVGQTPASEYYLVIKGAIAPSNSIIALNNANLGVASLKVKAPSSGLQAHIGSEKYLLAIRDGIWTAQSDTSLVSGNIDWKGSYDEGFVSLSYVGPPRRYIGNTFSNVIYKKGALFAQAPGTLHGAAIQTDSNGKKWVAAIIHDGTSDHVYCMSDAPNLNGNLYDPVTAPDGWRLINSFPMLVTESIYGPWFFNGSGNEAQTLRYVDDEYNGQPVTLMDRYRVSVDCNGSAWRSILGNERGLNAAPVLAVDYVGDQEVLLTLSNSNWFSVDYGLTSKSLIPASETEAENHEGAAFAGGGALSTFTCFDENGFYASDYYLGEGYGGVYIAIYYFDLRTNTVIYSKVLKHPDDNSFPNDYVTGSYRLRHDSKLVAEAERIIDTPVNGATLYPDWYKHPNTAPYDLMGYWEKEDQYNFSNGFLYWPENFNIAVDHQGNLLGSIKFNVLTLEGFGNFITPEPLNFLSDGNIDELLSRVPNTYSLTGAGVQ